MQFQCIYWVLAEYLPNEKRKPLRPELKTVDSFTGAVIGSYPLWFRNGAEDEGNWSLQIFLFFPDYSTQCLLESAYKLELQGRSYGFPIQCSCSRLLKWLRNWALIGPINKGLQRTLYYLAIAEFLHLNTFIILSQCTRWTLEEDSFTIDLMETLSYKE